MRSVLACGGAARPACGSEARVRLGRIDAGSARSLPPVVSLSCLSVVSRCRVSMSMSLDLEKKPVADSRRREENVEEVGDGGGEKTERWRPL
eukprot:scaffold17431_cov68-Phaeocystis_antarctica.AAC.1